MRASGVFSQVRARFAVIIFDYIAGLASCGTGCTAHRTAILKAVAWIDYDFIFGLSVAIEAGFAVLDITFGNRGCVIAFAARGTIARGIFAAASFANTIIRCFTSYIT